MRASPLCLMLLWLTACGGGSRAAGPSGMPPSKSPQAGFNAVSRTGCGPTDGPAVDVDVFDDIARCTDAKRAEQRANVGVWSGSLPEPGTVLRLDGEGGSASLCSRGECRSVQGAELSVSERHADGWSGVLRWKDAAGSHELPIHALDCPSEPIMCG